MRKNLGFIGIGILVLLIIFIVIQRGRKKKVWDAYTVKANTRWLPIRYVLFHPIKAFDDVRSENCGDTRIALGILATYILTHILRIGLTGFLFNNYRLETIKLSREIFIILGIYAIWSICNWALSTLMDGEGRIRDIIIVSSYAILPLILADIAYMVFSHLLTIREGAFLQFFSVVCMVWAFLLLFIGVLSIHRFTVRKNFAFVLLSTAGIVLVLFLISLVYSLFQQMMLFIFNVFTEVMYRI